ncbi:MAG TPA: DNA-processing protein DprA [Anaeromyxobacteraceae bacterium]|nr:DNA-processing protein DprA [Anaeromyxobacteraceae bacterium]
MDAARTLGPQDGQYPAALGRLADRPERLRVRGDLGDRRRIAVVGTRLPDGYGAEVTREIALGLARSGVSVVSGGAAGVDGVAHRAALEAGGHTIAVFGTGIDVAYPREHRGLFDEIVAAGGALVSELPDGSPPTPWTFPRRNRIVAALSEAVVVVRAGLRSGALITASIARRLGIVVFAVPGDVRERLSAGPHGLLREGARVAEGPDDVLAALGIVEGAGPAQLELPGAAAQPGGDAGRLLAALRSEPRHADDLAREAGLGPGPAMAALLSLELEGLCEQRPGRYFLRRS